MTQIQNSLSPPEVVGEDLGFGSHNEGPLIENAKIKVQSAKLRNPDLVGMGVLIVASFSISRVRYLLDVYYTSYTVGCQVKFWTRCSILDAGCSAQSSGESVATKAPRHEENHRFEDWTGIYTDFHGK
jgi:hypothetical protein